MNKNYEKKPNRGARISDHGDPICISTPLIPKWCPTLLLWKYACPYN